MIKTKFLVIIALVLFFQNSYSQKTDFSKYAIAMSEITTFADNPGFKNEVALENSSKEIKWATGEDGYSYTQDIEYIRVFGYKVLFESNNNLIIGVYYDSEGTAIYSYLFNVTATENKLVLNQVIGGGDRCHNAVILDEVEIENNVLSYSTLITPFKLMTWFSKPDKETSFDDCMFCCLGFANFKYDLIKQTLEFESIRVIQETLQEGTAIKKTYDDFVKERPMKLSLLLNKEELKEFIKACLKNH